MRWLSVFCAVFLLANPAHASTIYSSFGPGDTYDGTSGYTIGGTGVIVQGLQFIPTENAVVQTIEIAAFWLTGSTALNVSLTTDAGDQPGSVIETMPICCFGGVASIQLTHSVLHPLVTAGTKYWLVVSPIAAGDLSGWNRNRDLPLALNAQQSMGGPWNVSPGWLGAMRISGDALTPTMGTTWGRVKSLYH